MLWEVCGGSNPATGQKSPKCIYKISKNFRVRKIAPIRFDGLGQEKSLEISVFRFCILQQGCFSRSRIFSDYTSRVFACGEDSHALRLESERYCQVFFANSFLTK